MDPVTHKRYLDYRERHEYFGRTKPMLPFTEFALADAEQRTLGMKTARDDQEEQRFAELSKILFRD